MPKMSGGVLLSGIYQVIPGSCLSYLDGVLLSKIYQVIPGYA